jgi:lipopolysaccharide transport system permease protein
MLTGTFRVEAAGGWADLDLGELWAYRELIWFLVWRDIKIRYKQTSLGIAWAVIQPVTTAILLTVIFGRLVKVPSDGLPYPVFTYAALLPWQLFSSALMNSSNSIVGSSGLISKVYFPRLVIPIATVLATLVDFCISCLILIALMAWYHLTPGPAAALLPLMVALALASAFAVGLWASALNVRYRDVQYLMPFIVQVWLLASPVAYSASLISSARWRMIYALNPMAGVIQGFRWALLGGPAPSFGLMGLATVMIAVLLVGGLFFFKRTEAGFADII